MVTNAMTVSTVPESAGPASSWGFTLIELLVVMAALALLLSITMPRYVAHLDRAREAVLRTNLAAVREAIDRYQVDRGRLPDRLEELVAAGYLRAVPVDPFTERADTWTLIRSDGPSGGVIDIRSVATGKGRDGDNYVNW